MRSSISQRYTKMACPATTSSPRRPGTAGGGRAGTPTTVATTLRPNPSTSAIGEHTRPMSSPPSSLPYCLLSGIPNPFSHEHESLLPSSHFFVSSSRSAGCAVQGSVVLLAPYLLAKNDFERCRCGSAVIVNRHRQGRSSQARPSLSNPISWDLVVACYFTRI